MKTRCAVQATYTTDPMSTTSPTIDGSPTASLTHLPERTFVVLSGLPDQPARLLALDDGQEVTFGRSRAATISIDHEQVSRMHARLQREGDVVTIHDLGSRNGVRVNGERLTAPTALVPGDEVTLGPLTMVLGRSSRARRNRGGLTDHAALEQRLTAELDRSARYRRPLALAMIRLTGAEQDVDAAAERLADSVRPMDLIAEFGGN